MLKGLAVAALALSGFAFLFESHAMIWLVMAVTPGAIAALRAPPHARREEHVATVPQDVSRSRPAERDHLQTSDHRKAA